MSKEITINAKLAVDRIGFAMPAVPVIRRFKETVALFVLIRFPARKGTAWFFINSTQPNFRMRIQKRFRQLPTLHKGRTMLQIWRHIENRLTDL